MSSRIGATDPIEFLLMAIDGMEARLNGFQAQLDAIRHTAEGLIPKPAPSARLLQSETVQATAAQPEDARAGRRKKTAWTPAMRKAQAERMRQRWARGEFNAQVEPGKRRQRRAAAKPATRKDGSRNPWADPKARARLSRRMKAAYAKKKTATAAAAKSA